MTNEIIRDMPAPDYHAHPAISKSGLDQFRKSPAHYKHWLTAERKETAAMRIGTLTHLSVFQPELYRSRVVVAPIVDRRTKEGKFIWEQFKLENEGKDIVTHDDHSIIREMTTSVRGSDAGLMITGGAAEVSLFAAQSGVDCKARLDYVVDDVIVDLKTTEDASMAAFARSVANYRYHVQAAHYLALASELGMGVKRFVFIAVEKEAPYAIARYELDPADLMLAEADRQKHLARYASCQAFDSWPSYSYEIKILTLPKWATNNNDSPNP